MNCDLRTILEVAVTVACRHILDASEENDVKLAVANHIGFPKIKVQPWDAHYRSTQWLKRNI
jgi:hypothetical protein